MQTILANEFQLKRSLSAVYYLLHRLGDPIVIQVARVDVQRREMDFRLVRREKRSEKKAASAEKPEKKASSEKGKRAKSRPPAGKESNAKEETAGINFRFRANLVRECVSVRCPTPRSLFLRRPIMRTNIRFAVALSLPSTVA